jgi:hypothetical protein
LFGHLWEVELTYRIDTFLPSSSLLGLGSLIMFPLFATGVIYSGGKFVFVAKLVAKFATGVVYTSGAPWLANISANFRTKFEPNGILWG